MIGTHMEERARTCLRLVRSVHPASLEIREVTPADGGVRCANAVALINKGWCEWDVHGVSIRQTLAGMEVEL